MSSNYDIYCAIGYSIVLIDTAFSVHARSYFECNNCLPHSYIQTQPSRDFFFLFRCARIIFLSLITICTQSFFMFIFFLVVRTSYVDALQFLLIHQSNFRLNCFIDVSNFLLTSYLTLLVRI